MHVNICTDMYIHTFTRSHLGRVSSSVGILAESDREPHTCEVCSHIQTCAYTWFTYVYYCMKVIVNLTPACSYIQICACTLFTYVYYYIKVIVNLTPACISNFICIVRVHVLAHESDCEPRTRMLCVTFKFRHLFVYIYAITRNHVLTFKFMKNIVQIYEYTLFMHLCVHAYTHKLQRHKHIDTHTVRFTCPRLKEIHIQKHNTTITHTHTHTIGVSLSNRLEGHHRYNEYR